LRWGWGHIEKMFGAACGWVGERGEWYALMKKETTSFFGRDTDE